MKASFIKRVLAYFMDVMFVTLVAGLIATGFTSSKYEESYKQYEDLTEKYVNGEITIEEYTKQYGPIAYDMEKSSMPVSIVTVVLSIAYFIVFQYLNKGQTIAKKLLKLRVVEKDKAPSLKAIIIRTSLIDSILTGVLGLVLLTVLNKNNYFVGKEIIYWLEVIFVFVTAMFILYRKDKKGLHDIIAHTEVIDERGR